MARRVIYRVRTREEIREAFLALHPEWAGTEMLERMVELESEFQETKRLRLSCLIVPDDFPLEEGTETEPVADDLFGFTRPQA